MGTTLVPDLAAAIPEASDDGLRYQFRASARIVRFSTGAPVRPSDVGRSIERVVSAHGADGPFGAIVGAAACGNASPVTSGTASSRTTTLGR